MVLIKFLEFSILIRDGQDDLTEHVVAYVEGIEAFQRAISTTDDEGNVALLAKKYGTVYTLDGDYLSEQSLRLQNARIRNFRDGRTSADCSIDRDMLLSMAV